MAKATILPIKPKLLIKNETEYFAVPEEDKPFIKAVYAAYVYDEHQHHHLCEITPSYELRFLYHQVELTEAGEELPDEERERLYTTYEDEGSEDCYQHVNEIERLPQVEREQACSEIKGAKRIDLGFESEPIPCDDHDQYEEVMDSIVEGLNCNRVF